MRASGDSRVKISLRIYMTASAKGANAARNACTRAAGMSNPAARCNSVSCLHASSQFLRASRTPRANDGISCRLAGLPCAAINSRSMTAKASLARCLTSEARATSSAALTVATNGTVGMAGAAVRGAPQLPESSVRFPIAAQNSSRFFGFDIALRPADTDTPRAAAYARANSPSAVVLFATCV